MQSGALSRAILLHPSLKESVRVVAMHVTENIAINISALGDYPTREVLRCRLGLLAVFR